MGSVGCAVLIEGMVGIAMVSDNDCAIAIALAASTTFSTHLSSVSTAFWIAVYTPVWLHHVAISEIHYYEVILFSVDGRHKFLCHLRCAHFRPQVVGGNLGRRHKNAVFALEWASRPPLKKNVT